jgi:hypothetical protein
MFRTMQGGRCSENPGRRIDTSFQSGVSNTIRSPIQYSNASSLYVQVTGQFGLVSNTIYV